MYGGSVLSITTRERARCEIRPAETLTLASADGSQAAVIRQPGDLALRGDHLDIARAVVKWFGLNPTDARLVLSLSTDIPMQAGMAGSTALVVAAVGALDRHFQW